MKRILLVACAAAMLAGCANSGTGAVPPKTVEKVDLERYQGTWYEQARLPMFFQRNCKQSEAHYALQADGSVSVINKCRDAEGKWQEAVGQAVPQVEGKTDKLWVSFDNWFSDLLPGVAKGEYWVLYLDDDYQHALVGSPNHKYLWLLSRSTELSQAARTKMLEVAHGQGYNTEDLIWRTPDAEMPMQ